jgi:hypothetical protein
VLLATPTARSRVRRGLALGATVALIGGLAASTADAATPSSGSVSPTSSVLQYTASFTTPATCDGSGSAPCGDEFKLHVATPAGYGDNHALTVQVDWPNEAADYDVYLRKDGKEVASAASTADPEQLFAPADSGDYIVRIVPYLPLPSGGQIVTSTVRLVDRSSPKTSSLPKPSYKNFKAPEGGRSVHDAGEPTVGINWKTGAAMYQAGLSTYRVNFTSSSAIWTEKSARPPDCTQATSLDPYLFTDNQLGRTFSSQLTGVGSLTCFTDNDGDTWTPSTGGGIPSGVDHQSLGGGPFAPNDPLPHSNYPHAVYYCSQDIADALCALSRDGGATFGTGNKIYDLRQCAGLHGHIKVAPDGTAYVPNKNCNGKQGVSVSRDNGKTWTVRRVPTSLGRSGDSDPSVGLGSNNTLYFGYQNRDLSNPPKFATARIAVSHDQGETFVRDTDVGAQLGLKNIVFPAVIAGDDNRAAFAFLGTKTAGDYQDNDDTDGTPSFKGIWHLYIATTTDGGASWVTVDATPNDPVQRGSICTGGTTCGEDRNLLDFMDLDLDAQGRGVVGYADGCTGPCVTGAPDTDPTYDNYHDAYATIARQSAGPRLFGRYDQKPDLVVTNLQLTKDATGEHVSGLVTNAGNATANNVVVLFREGCGCGTTFRATTSPGFTLAPGQSKRVGVLDPRNLSGSHTYTAIVDPANVVDESNESNNKARRSFNC